MYYMMVATSTQVPFTMTWKKTLKIIYTHYMLLMPLMMYLNMEQVMMMQKNLEFHTLKRNSHARQIMRVTNIGQVKFNQLKL